MDSHLELPRLDRDLERLRSVDLVPFAAAMIDGGTAMELSAGSKSSEEIGSLWRFLSDRMEGKVDLALRHVS